ncbi:hypothetical protein PISMIDRAFT_410730 [Pisolithus microcarpus 441]|uniref:Uncharacterized protein n=1 Tax=Pisolithus microcarpus 441 TaxID=765257 RepID=A0A0C9XLP0_9AGAM|nr:hypothetical protein BKA83DRAFT_410730 [Pisolithus microcarpus]KIK13285.1 hypothetical protein PISMIDRAFT_410730 [Pisolithus microcarpus 441]
MEFICRMMILFSFKILQKRNSVEPTVTFCKFVRIVLCWKPCIVSSLQEFMLTMRPWSTNLRNWFLLASGYITETSVSCYVILTMINQQQKCSSYIRVTLIYIVM